MPQIRLDSFAKFLAPGLRLGWVTAAAPLVEKLTFCIHGSSLGACATTQARRPLLVALQFPSTEVQQFVQRCCIHFVRLSVRIVPSLRGSLTILPAGSLTLQICTEP